MMRNAKNISFSKLVLLFLLSFVILTLPQIVLADGASNQSQSLINDKMLEEAIRDELNKPEGELTKKDLEQLTYLPAISLGIKDLSGLEYAINLETLYLYRNEITDLSPLKKLIKLKKLHIYENKIKDISPLSNLINLESLELASNEISNIKPLANLKRLNYLNLNYNKISNISYLSSLRQLETLKLSYNQISDISPLTSLKNITFIGLSNNKISDISPLTKLPKLIDIFLADNQISDISAFEKFNQSLEWIFIQRNQITDISPLVELGKRGQLRGWVYILFNKLDIDNKDSKAWADIQTLLDYNVVISYDPQLPKVTSDTTGIYGDVRYSGRIDGNYREHFPLENAIVTIFNSKDEIVRTVLANEDGAFSIDGLSPGKYTVKTSSDNFSTKFEEITLKAGESTYIRHDLDYMYVYGYVKDIYGQPVKDFEIDLVGNDNVNNVFAKKDNGYFYITDFNPGIYELTVISKGYQIATKTIELSEPKQTDFQLTPFDETKSMEDYNKIRVRNGKELMIFNDLPADLNGRPLLPLKELFNIFEIGYSYNAQEQAITAWKDNKKIKLKIGSNQVEFNGQLIEYTADITVIEGKSFIPLDLLNGILDGGIVWDKKIQTVSIYDSEIIPIPDQYLKQSLRTVAGKNYFDEITLSDLESLTSLILHDFTKDLTGLEYAKNLESLTASWNSNLDLSALESLNNLKSLILVYSSSPNIEVIGKIKSLETLVLKSVYIKDLSFLKELTNLKNLDLSKNYSMDLSPISNLTNMETLEITGSNINDISSLANLKNLRVLDILNNPVTDLTPLSNLTNLIQLYVETDKITDKTILPDLIELEMYVTENNLLEVNRLLQQGVDPNAAYLYGDTLLMKAADLGYYNVSKALIKAGANIDAENDWERSVLEYAIAGKNEKIVDLLIENGVKVEGDDLNAAVYKEYINIVKKLLDYGANPNELLLGNTTVLMKAAGSGDYNMVKLLLDYGADPYIEDNDGRTALYRAYIFGFDDIVELLWNEMNQK